MKLAIWSAKPISGISSMARASCLISPIGGWTISPTGSSPFLPFIPSFQARRASAMAVTPSPNRSTVVLSSPLLKIFDTKESIAIPRPEPLTSLRQSFRSYTPFRTPLSTVIPFIELVQFCTVVASVSAAFWKRSIVLWPSWLSSANTLPIQLSIALIIPDSLQESTNVCMAITAFSASGFGVIPAIVSDQFLTVVASVSADAWNLSMRVWSSPVPGSKLATLSPIAPKSAVQLGPVSAFVTALIAAKDSSETSMPSISSQKALNPLARLRPAASISVVAAVFSAITIIPIDAASSKAAVAPIAPTGPI